MSAKSTASDAQARRLDEVMTAGRSDAAAARAGASTALAESMAGRWAVAENVRRSRNSAARTPRGRDADGLAEPLRATGSMELAGSLSPLGWTEWLAGTSAPPGARYTT